MRAAFLSCATLASYVVFIIAITFGAPCPERCPDDGPDGRCPPACTACACAPHPAPPGAAVSACAPPAQAERVHTLAVLVPRAPEPRDIFHVPKRLLA